MLGSEDENPPYWLPNVCKTSCLNKRIVCLYPRINGGVHVAAFTVLILGATRSGEDVNYSIYSISLAMFLMKLHFIPRQPGQRCSSFLGGVVRAVLVWRRDDWLY